MKISKRHSLPIEDFYELYKPQNVKKYTPVQAMAQQIKNKHHGPWE